MHCSLWVPGSRAEPFFSLCPRRSSWIRCPQARAGLPPARFAAYVLRGITRTRSLPSGSPLHRSYSSALLSVLFVDPPPDNRRRQYRHQRYTRRGGNDSVQCAMSRPEVPLRGVSRLPYSASWLANRPVVSPFRSLHRTDSTELVVARPCSFPTGGDTAAEGKNRTPQRS